MKKIMFRWWPVAFILGVWMLFAAPYFFQGLVPYPSKYQTSFFSPWNAYQQYWGPVKNNAMPDVIDQIYPWKHFTIAWLKKGIIPFWNPYNFAGNPHVANFQSAVFSPFTLLFFVLPFIDAWSLVVLLQPLLAGLFLYLFLKEHTDSPFAQTLGSVTYMFCGFIVVWMAYGTLSMAAAFLPLALWGIERGYTKRTVYFGVMSLSLAVSFFSGHFQTSLYVVMYCLAYVLYKWWITKDKKKVFLAILFFVLGVIVSLPQLYPTVIFYQHSVRSGLVYAGGGIPVDYIISTISPDFFGNPVTRNDWRGNYAEWASFIGIIPMLFSLLAVFGKKQKTVVYFFLAAGIGSLLLSLETPLHQLLIATHLPILATSIPSRMIVLFSFSFSVLAGLGLSEFVSLSRKDLLRRYLPGIGVVAFLILATFLSLTVTHVTSDKVRLGFKNVLLPVALLGITGSLLASQKYIRSKKFVVLTTTLIVVLASFDSYRFAAKWMPYEPRSLVFPDLPVISAMQKNIGFGRVYGNLGAQVETYYGLSSLEGYDPLYVQRYGEFLRFAAKGTYQPAERSVATLDRRGKYTDRVLDLLGVNLIFHPLADTGQSWAYPVWQDIRKYSVLYQDDKFQIYKNNTAMPRATLFYHYKVVTNSKALLQEFYSDAFPFRSILLLEESPRGLSAQSSHATGSARIISYTPNAVTIAVDSTNSGLLFLSDTAYPGWQAFINGKEVSVYRADYAFRAVVVPQGKSQVEFRFNPFFD